MRRPPRAPSSATSAPTKTAYLLAHRNRLGNQLWNLIAVHAFCVERGYTLCDCAAFDYHRYFAFPPSGNSLLDAYLEAADRTAPLWDSALLKRARHVRGVRQLLVDGLSRMPARLAFLPPDAPELRASGGVVYLPPSPPSDPAYEAIFDEAERRGSLCFRGWLFKNPTGIVRHRSSILAHLTPRPGLFARVQSFLHPYRSRYSKIVGVHIRKGDYQTWLGGKVYVSEHQARPQLDELLRRRGWRSADTLFIVCSDGPIDLSAFAGLTVVRGPGEAMEDLLVLASCDALIGSNSTFAGFASYYGNIPLIVLGSGRERGGVDWDYYAGRGGYFEDKHFIINFLAGARESEMGDGSYFRD